MSDFVIPEVGALVSWRAMTGKIVSGEVVSKRVSESNGQRWVLVRLDYPQSGTLECTEDNDWTAVVNP